MPGYSEFFTRLTRPALEAFCVCKMMAISLIMAPMAKPIGQVVRLVVEVEIGP
jgi:hypothetical protein